eukprot:TRINITY_DN6680_c1_g2_i1.p1 TRINITY_DN6680_c1_g2~~TRINITY_DN6680_c1_g2_i1.p1  ORF type:complete len:113 (+),score=17.18 TRINITY_DN6680_c1_g2_i1:38-376(+)
MQYVIMMAMLCFDVIYTTMRVCVVVCVDDGMQCVIMMAMLCFDVIYTTMRVCVVVCVDDGMQCVIRRAMLGFFFFLREEVTKDNFLVFMLDNKVILNLNLNLNTPKVTPWLT